jgi:hypothetical protein
VEVTASPWIDGFGEDERVVVVAINSPPTISGTLLVLG